MSRFDGHIAAAKREKPFGRGWQLMDTAPKDGTIVEIESRAGVKPHRDLYRWTDKTKPTCLETGEVGKTTRTMNSSAWVSVNQPSISIAYGAHCWRPWVGDPATFKDPFQDIDDFDYAVLGKRPDNTAAGVLKRLFGAVFA